MKIFSYEVGFNFGYAKNEYVDLDEPESRRPHLILNGKSSNRGVNGDRGLIALGIIRTQQQLDQLLSSGYKMYGVDPRIGDLYFQDLRGDVTADPQGNTPDGVIDGNDRNIIIDSKVPLFNYGIRLGFNYKRFTFEAFMQGFGGHQKYTPSAGRFQFAGAGQSAWSPWLDSFHAERNPNGNYPRFGSHRSDNNSTFWMHDADFLRMKNLTLGYNLPDSWVNKVGAQRVNVFANATNLFLIYSKIKDFDPETTGRGIPVNKSFNVGLNVTF